jgi:hypothetical protein
MPTIPVLVLAIAGFLASAPTSSNEAMRLLADTRLAQANSGRICAQVISCGTKDGKRKEYPTPCAAQDDGATNIAPRSGPTCGDSR